MKKIIFVFSAIAVGFMLSGCQTTNTKQQVDTLSAKVQTLENTIQDRDRELSQLQGQVDQLSQQVAEQEKASQVRQQALAAAPLENKDRLGIIKVPVKSTDVQSALKAAGFYAGEVDGKVGANTISAIAAFQKANSLPVDSIVGPKTWELLKTYLK
jgi:outer membrane murein-binding lipoprotein Lpp